MQGVYPRGNRVQAIIVEEPVVFTLGGDWRMDYTITTAITTLISLIGSIHDTTGVMDKRSIRGIILAYIMLNVLFKIISSVRG